jgi:hypothetical protein
VGGVWMVGSWEKNGGDGGEKKIYKLEEKKKKRDDFHERFSWQNVCARRSHLPTAATLDRGGGCCGQSTNSQTAHGAWCLGWWMAAYQQTAAEKQSQRHVLANALPLGMC